TRIRRGYASGVARVAFDAKHGTRYRSRSGSGLRARIWDVFVGSGAARMTPEELESRGRGIDRILDRVPPAIGFRLVALAVDAAALAGYRQAVTSVDAPVSVPVDGDRP